MAKLINTNDTVKIDISKIFIELHNIASEQSKISGYEIFNSAVKGTGTNAKFQGAGLQVLQIVLTDSKTPISKNDCLNALKTYSNFFAGDDVVSEINIDSLKPMYRPKIKGESQLTKSFKTFLLNNNVQKYINILFETTQEQDEEVAKENDTILFGYQLEYRLEINDVSGNDSTVLKKSMKWLKDEVAKASGISKDILSSTFDMLYNWAIAKRELDLTATIKFSSLYGGGGSSELGKKIKLGDIIKHPKDIIDKFSYRELDPQKTTHSIETEFNKVFPGVTPTINILNSKSIFTYIEKHKNLLNIKLSLKQIDNLKNTHFSLALKVDHRDMEYEDINIEKIAKIINTAIKNRGLGKLTLPNSISSSDIIYIKNYNDRLKSKSDAKYITGKSNSETTDESIDISNIISLLFEQITDPKIQHDVLNCFYPDDTEDGKKLNIKLKNKLLDPNNKLDLKVYWIQFDGLTELDKYNLFKTRINNLINVDGKINRWSMQHLTNITGKAVLDCVKEYKPKIDKDEEFETNVNNKNTSSALDLQPKHIESGYDAYIIPLKNLKYKTEVKDTKPDKSNKTEK